MKTATSFGPNSNKLSYGLATLALLKANYDSGIDHLDMLLPFVVDCVINFPKDDFAAEEIRALLGERYGLQIPTTSMQLVLSRARKRRILRREGGRYFRNQVSRSTTPDIQKLFTEIQVEHSVIAKAFIEFGVAHRLNLPTEEDALALLFEFVSQFHVELLLDPTAEDGGAPVFLNHYRRLGTNESRIVAKFILTECFTKPELKRIIRRILEGFVLQNALLLKDIATAQGRFKDLTAYFDTAFLLNALGLAGDAARVAARDSIDLLKLTNVSLAVFESTVSEIRRILFVYERHLGSQKGIETLRPYPVTRHLISRHYSPSDVREISALLPFQLDALGFRIVPVPDHVKSYTFDEADLTRRLKRPDEPDTEPRVVHDVDCIASVLTLRRGLQPESYDSAKAVFATTAGLLVRNVKDWAKAQGLRGVYPVIHAFALSSIAWLKKPVAVTDLKLSELIALCTAALAPTQRTWGLFIRHLQKMREEKIITNDEMVTVIASELTDSLLSQFDDDVEPDSTTLTEVVSRVKESYMSEAATRIQQAQDQASHDVTTAQAQTAEARERLKVSEEAQRMLMLKIRARANSIGSIVGKGFFLLAILLLVIFPPLLGSVIIGIWSYIVSAVGWIAGVGIILRGGHVQEWRRAVELFTEKRFRRWFGVEE